MHAINNNHMTLYIYRTRTRIPRTVMVYDVYKRAGSILRQQFLPRIRDPMHAMFVLAAVTAVKIMTLNPQLQDIWESPTPGYITYRINLSSGDQLLVDETMRLIYTVHIHVHVIIHS